MKKFKIAISLFLFLFMISGCKNKENQVEENKEPQKQVESKETIQDFQFQLLNAKLENGSSEFEFEITNISNETKKINKFRVTVKDESGKDLVSLTNVMNKELETNDKVIATCSYGGDLSNYHSFEYELLD